MSELEHVRSSRRGSSTPIALPKPTKQPRVFGSWISRFLCQRGIKPRDRAVNSLFFQQQHCFRARFVVLFLGAGFPKASGIQEWNWNAA